MIVVEKMGITTGTFGRSNSPADERNIEQTHKLQNKLTCLPGYWVAPKGLRMDNKPHC